MENKIKIKTTLTGVLVRGLAALHQSSVINHCESMWIWQQCMPSFRDKNVQCLPKGKLLQLVELSANVHNMPLHTPCHVRAKNAQCKRIYVNVDFMCHVKTLQDVQESLCPTALQTKPPEIHLAILKPVKAALWNLNVIASVLISKFHMETCNVMS